MSEFDLRILLFRKFATFIFANKKGVQILKGFRLYVVINVDYIVFFFSFRFLINAVVSAYAVVEFLKRTCSFFFLLFKLKR